MPRIIRRKRKFLEAFGFIEFMDLASKNPKGGRPERLKYLEVV